MKKILITGGTGSFGKVLELLVNPEEAAAIAAYSKALTIGENT